MLAWLRENGTEASLPRLQKLIETWDKDTWWYAMNAYSGAGGRKAVPFLLKTFKAGRTDVRLHAADSLGSIYWREWSAGKKMLPPEPEVVETLKTAILSDADNNLRESLIGNFCHNFYPRLPDTGAFLLKAAETEGNMKVRAQMKQWAEHMDKMYSAVKP
jgi:hypothetical protein